MVCLRTCGPCGRGEHTSCEGGHTPDQSAGMVLGGWICSCRCGGKSEAERAAEWDKHFEDTMEWYKNKSTMWSQGE